MKDDERAVVNGDVNVLAIVEYIWTSSHDVTQGEAKVLDVCDNWHVKCLLESWHNI